MVGILILSLELTWELWSDSELNAFKENPLDAPMGDNFNNLIKSTCSIIYFFRIEYIINNFVDTTRNSLS